MTKLESKELSRNIRYRLADMLGNQWSGALDAAMDEMLLEEIDHLHIRKIKADEGPVHVEPNDGSSARPLRKWCRSDSPYTGPRPGGSI